MRLEPGHDQLRQLRMSPLPAVLDVEVDDFLRQPREAPPDGGEVVVLGLVHHEDVVRPVEQLAGDHHLAR